MHPSQNSPYWYPQLLVPSNEANQNRSRLPGIQHILGTGHGLTPSSNLQNPMDGLQGQRSDSYYPITQRNANPAYAMSTYRNPPPQSTLSVPQQTPSATDYRTSFGPGDTRENSQDVGNTASRRAPVASPIATYHGYLATIDDAHALVRAVEQGLLTPLGQKPSEDELRCIRSGSVFVWKRKQGFRIWMDKRSWSLPITDIDSSFRQYYETDKLGERLTDGLSKTVCTYSDTLGIVSYYRECDTSKLTRPSDDLQFQQATSTDMTSPPTTGVQSNDVDDKENGDNWDDNMIDAESSAISPDLEGFRQHVLRLNPNLAHTNKFLVDRFANALLDRYNELLVAKMRHSSLEEPCSCGPLCLSRRSQRDLDASSGLGDVLPPDIPMPPTHSLSAEFECPICFTLKKPNTPSQWIKHVFEDVQPFRCTWETCVASDSFKSQSDWNHHETESHRHPNSWTCSFRGCDSDKFDRSEEFQAHLRTAHHVRSSARNAKALLPKPQDESCRFCGKKFSSWEDLTGHLANHMRQISSPLVHLVAQNAMQNPPTATPNSATASKRSSLESEATVSSCQTGPPPAYQKTPITSHKRPPPQHVQPNPKRIRTSDESQPRATDDADPDAGGHTTTCNSLMVPAPSGNNTFPQANGSQPPPSASFSTETSTQTYIKYRIMCCGKNTQVSLDWEPRVSFRCITLSQLANVLSENFGPIQNVVHLSLRGDGIDAQSKVETGQEELFKFAKEHFKEAILRRVSGEPTDKYQCVIEIKVDSTREVVEKVVDDVGEFPW